MSVPGSADQRRPVDFRRRLITVQAAYAKNGEARSVPMNPVLTAALQAIKIPSTDEAQMFWNGKGALYRSFCSAFERALRVAGITDFTFHDLRHTFASRLEEAGVDLATVRELLGCPFRPKVPAIFPTVPWSCRDTWR